MKPMQYLISPVDHGPPSPKTPSSLRFPKAPGHGPLPAPLVLHWALPDGCNLHNITSGGWQINWGQALTSPAQSISKC